MSDMDRFYLQNQHQMEVRKHYQLKITKKFTSLENLDENEDINRVLENIRRNMKILTKREQTTKILENTLRHASAT